MTGDTRKDGGPAFPAINQVNWFKGMSLRDWFAGQALIGVQMAQIHGALTGSGARFLEESDTAEAAYSIADAMLTARSDGDNGNG